MGNGNVSIGNWFVGDEFSVPYDKHAMKLGEKKEKKGSESELIYYALAHIGSIQSASILFLSHLIVQISI